MDVKKLQKSMLFREMSEEEILSALEELGWHEQDFQKGEFIFTAGSKTDELGLVESGSVSIERTDWSGDRSILNLVETGNFFAETYAFLKDEVMLVDVLANEDCRILFLRVGSLPALLRRTGRWQRLFLRNLLMISMQKNLILSEKNFHTAPKSARARIMAYLQTVSIQKKSREFDIPFDRQQMADYLNLDRTALSKELGKMKTDGILAFRKNHFRLITQRCD